MSLQNGIAGLVGPSTRKVKTSKYDISFIVNAPRSPPVSPDRRERIEATPSPTCGSECRSYSPVSERSWASLSPPPSSGAMPSPSASSGQFGYFSLLRIPQVSYLGVLRKSKAGRKRKLDYAPSSKSCIWCRGNKTPQWRLGPDGKRSLCNACGLEYAKHKKRMTW
ncbi:blue light receptor [Kappamyces sp. JEL0680]|nr:blue light receptor [Kappamyces sp. JEL0680]